MLEDELTSILVDDDIKQLIIVDSSEQQGLARKLRSQNRPFLITDFEQAFNLVKKHQQGTYSSGHSIKGHSGLQQLLHRRSVDDLVVVVNVLKLRWLAMTKADEAVALFKQGFNCSQAVLAVFGPDYGLDQGAAARVAQGFGAGVARTDDICGAVFSAIMVIGLRYGGVRADDSAAREKTYTVVGEFIRDFTQRNNTVACTELLGYNMSDPHQYAEAKELKVFRARCPGFVREAVELVEKVI